MARKRIGTIVVPPGVFIDKHEKLAVDFLATKIAYNITFLLPDRRKGSKTPDIEMNGLPWEIKSLKGKSSRTIENNIRQALRQSPYIIIDLRHMDGRVPTKKLVDKVESQFNIAKPIKHIMVITRQDTILEFKR